jgi:hypothetical protein
MLREHFINFLEAAVVLLILTNTFSALAAAYAILGRRGLIRRNLLQQPVPLKVVAGGSRR